MPRFRSPKSSLSTKSQLRKLPQGCERLIEDRRSLAAQNPLAVSYEEYRRTPQWKKIKQRVLKRDGKRCVRCGGAGRMVHHRSYADEVMLGNNDNQLASICEGCHNIIHFDDSGNRRTVEEVDQVLLMRDESETFPPPKVDMRRTKNRAHPAEWHRMTAVQRIAWHKEYERLKIIRWVQAGKSPAIVRSILKTQFGMSKAEINTALSVTVPKHRSGRRD